MRDSAILKTALWMIVFSVCVPLASAADGPTTAPIDFVGRVVAQDGKPIPGARVSTWPIANVAVVTPPLGMATTGADGQFRIPGAAGAFNVSIQASGFGFDLRRLEVNERSLPFELELKPGILMRVSAIDENGKPLAGIRIAPSQFPDRVTQGSGDLPRQIRNELAKATDESGACIFSDMPRGESFGFSMLDPNYQNTSAFVYASNGPLGEASPLQLKPAGTIEGILIDGLTGNPVPNITISARTLVADAGRNVVYGGSATTEPDGRFSLIQLRPGDYTLMPMLSPSLVLQRAAEAVGPVKAASGQPVKDLLLNIVSGVTVRGKVTMENTAAPAAGARVSLTQIGPLAMGNMTSMTDANGAYSLQVMPGEYRVTTTSGGAQLAPSRTITVTEGPETVLDIQAPPSRNAPLTGRVVDENGLAVAGAQVILRLDDLIARGLIGEQSIVLTDQDGRFAADQARNGMTLYARHGEARLAAPVAVNVTGGTARRGGPVVEPQTNLNLVLINNARGEVVVRVVDENDKPVANALVRVYHRNDGADAALARTAPDGTLRVPGLYIDQYYVVSTRPNGYAVGSMVPKPEAGKQIDAPPIKLVKADGFIAGMVVNEQGQPLANAEVSTLGGRTERQTVRTTEGGQFRIEGLMPGETLSIITRTEANGPTGSNRIAVGTADAVIMHTPLRPTTSGARRGF